MRRWVEEAPAAAATREIPGSHASVLVCMYVRMFVCLCKCVYLEIAKKAAAAVVG